MGGAFFNIIFSKFALKIFNFDDAFLNESLITALFH